MEVERPYTVYILVVEAKAGNEAATLRGTVCTSGQKWPDEVAGGRLRLGFRLNSHYTQPGDVRPGLGRLELW
jgi:hypothetical protein